MKYLIKKYWLLLLIAFVINLPIFITGVIPTNQTLTLKGDTTKIESFLEIDGEYNESGSFSSIYVITFDNSTVLQNMFVDWNFYEDRNEISEYVSHLSGAEQYRAGQIQKQSSIQNSLILAYSRAKEKREDVIFNYEFESVIVSYYEANSSFRIGDKITAVDGVLAANNELEFIKAVNSSKENSVFKVVRDENEIEIVRGTYYFSGYKSYKIDSATAFPKFTVKSTNTGGPSAGFLQALSLYNRLIPEDLTKGLRIAGTGTIDVNGNVGAIGGIKQKVATAFEDNMQVFFCPEANSEEGQAAYNQLSGKERMKFIVVSTLDEAIKELEKL